MRREWMFVTVSLGRALSSRATAHPDHHCFIGGYDPSVLLLGIYRLTPYHFEIGQLIGITFSKRFTWKILPIDAAIDFNEEQNPDIPHLGKILLVSSNAMVYLILSIPFLTCHGLIGSFSWLHDNLVPILLLQPQSMPFEGMTFFSELQMLSCCCFIILLLHAYPGRGMALHNIIKTALGIPLSPPSRSAFVILFVSVSYLLMCVSISAVHFLAH